MDSVYGPVPDRDCSVPSGWLVPHRGWYSPVLSSATNLNSSHYSVSPLFPSSICHLPSFLLLPEWSHHDWYAPHSAGNQHTSPQCPVISLSGISGSKHRSCLPPKKPATGCHGPRADSVYRPLSRYRRGCNSRRTSPTSAEHPPFRQCLSTQSGRSSTYRCPTAASRLPLPPQTHIYICSST